MPISIRTSIGARIGVVAGSARITIGSSIAPEPYRAGVLSAGGAGGLGLVAGGTVGVALNASNAGGSALISSRIVTAVLAATGAGAFLATNSMYATGVLSAGSVGAMMPTVRTIARAAVTANGAGTANLAAITTKAAGLAAAGIGSLNTSGRAIKGAIVAASGAGTTDLVRGTAGVTVNFVDLSLSDTQVSPTNAGTVYGIYTNGTDSGGVTWLLSGSASEIEVYASVTSGTLSSGSEQTEVWLPLTSSRQWFKTRTINFPGSTEATLAMECRRASDGASLDSWSVTLTAIVEGIEGGGGN